MATTEGNDSALNYASAVQLCLTTGGERAWLVTSIRIFVFVQFVIQRIKRWCCGTAHLIDTHMRPDNDTKNYSN